MDNLVSLLHAVGPAAVNQDVRGRMLELVQSWATATEERHELKYINEVYRTLQKEGYQFPPRVTVASSMIDSSAVSYAFSVFMAPRAHLFDVAPRVDRFGCVYAMPDRVYLHQPKTSLS